MKFATQNKNKSTHRTKSAASTWIWELLNNDSSKRSEGEYKMDITDKPRSPAQYVLKHVQKVFELYMSIDTILIRCLQDLNSLVSVSQGQAG